MILSFFARLFTVVTALFALLIAACMVLGGQLSNDEVAFDSTRNGNADVYLLDVQRNLSIPLTRSPNDDYGAAWSPDGAYLAYLSENDTERAVYVMSANGRASQRLTSISLTAPNPTLAWSPDGTTLALTTNDNGGNTQSVFLIGADGANLRRVSGDPGSAFAPTWSQGSEIAFSWSPVANTEVYVMDINQPESVRRITNSPLTDTSPSWSPDGREIAFISDRNGPSDIYLMNPDGTNLRPITQDRSIEASPSWSSDSRHLIFVSNRSGSRNIYMIARDGSAITQLTFSSVDDLRPAWRP